MIKFKKEIIKEQNDISMSFLGKFVQNINNNILRQSYGNLYSPDIINKPSGQYYGYSFFNNDGSIGLRYMFLNNFFVGIDILNSIKTKKSIYFNIDSNDNIDDSVGIAIKSIYKAFEISELKNLKSENLLVEKEIVTNIKEKGSFDINKLMSSIGSKSSIYSWIKNVLYSQSKEKRDELLKYLKTKDYIDLYRLYFPWSKTKNKNQIGKIYKSYGGFLLNMRHAYEESGVVTVAKPRKALITNPEPEQLSVNPEENVTYEKLKKSFKQTPNQIIENLKVGMKMVLSGISYSLIVAGDAGIGKTKNIRDILDKSGLKKREISTSEFELLAISIKDNDTNTIKQLREQSKNSYMYVSGGASPLGMYYLMYINNGGIIVFDDCDDVFLNPLGVNLIKAATDNKRERTVSYATKNTIGKKSLVPPQFDFVGKIIFITNLHMDKISSAIASRANIIEFDFSFEETTKMIEKQLSNLGKDIPGLNMKMKKEVLTYIMLIGSKLGEGSKIDFRTFLQCLRYRICGMPNWKKAAGSLILSKQGTY